MNNNTKVKKKSCDLSIIIPSKNFLNSLILTLNALLKQTLLPNEIIIIDSSENNINKNYINTYFKNNLIKFISVKSKFPGEARNYGASLANSKFISFLDSKTVPQINWIEDYMKIFTDKNVDVIFGLTKYIAKTKKQKKIIAATHGFNPIETTPGSMIKKNIFEKKNIFIENVRTADDLEWRTKIRNDKYKTFTPLNYYLEYKDIPDSLIQNIKRYFIYSFHTARVDIQTKTKTLYLCTFLILTTIFIPKWNWIISGWDQSPLYIPNITKIYFFSILSFFFIFILVNNFILKRIISRLTNATFKVLFIILILYFFLRFKISVASSLENFINFIPHTVQYYLLLLIITSAIFRGIFIPLSRGVSIKYLFPTNLFSIMLYGLLIDITKSPGYLLGAIYQFINVGIKKRRNISKIVFLTKYSQISASVRHRFLIYKSELEKKGFEVNLSYMFDDNFFHSKIHHNKILYFKMIISYLRRIFILLKLNKNSLVVIHLELIPFSFSLGERILKLKGIKYIIDLDDAIYLRNEKFEHDINVPLKKYNPFVYSFKNAESIFVGNKFIKNYVANYNNNLFEIPTIIDLKKIDIKIAKKRNKLFTIVWIGSPSTSVYLKQVIPYLSEIYKNNKFKLRLIGSDKFHTNEFEFECYDWSESNEIELISQSHLGIMPLPDTLWSRSKCGFKLIQYMACGIPAIASPVGINKDIIKDGINGYLCSNRDDWISKINFCINNKKYLSSIGKIARKSIEDNYSNYVWLSKYTNKINEISKS